MSRKTGSLKLSSNIEPRASAPLDARLVVPTLADLTASGAFPYPYVGMIVAVQATCKAYILKAIDTTNSENWEEVGSSIDTSKLYSTDDSADTDIADIDYFPYYDSSAENKKKALWSTVKSVLKSYFDTLYNTKPTIKNATLTAGSTSVSFSDVPTSGNYLITPFTSVVGLDYDSVSQNDSTVTVTFASQSSDVTVYLKIEEV